MIIKGNPSGRARYWARYLLKKADNDRVQLIDVWGTLSTDVAGALEEMQLVSKGTRSQGKFLYVASINPHPLDCLTPNQWREAVDLLEKNLNLTEHPRIVVEHEKAGRIHRHVVWSRVTENLRIVDIGGNFYTHMATSRALEERFDLVRVRSRSDKRKFALPTRSKLSAKRASLSLIRRRSSSSTQKNSNQKLHNIILKEFA